jgi:hypothetical protein
LGDDVGAVRAHSPLLRHAPEEIFAGRYNMFAIDRSTQKVISRYFMHWQNDGRSLIVNYFSGSDRARPLIIRLVQEPAQTPIDLSELIYSDVLTRLKKTDDQVYHYYVYYIADLGDRVRVSAQPDYTLEGTDGSGWGRCLIYTVNKANFVTFRFEREIPWQRDDLECPRHPDEKWD